MEGREEGRKNREKGEGGRRTEGRQHSGTAAGHQYLCEEILKERQAMKKLDQSFHVF